MTQEKEKKSFVNTYVPNWLKERVEIIAKKTGLSATAIMTNALLKEVEVLEKSLLSLSTTTNKE